MNKYFDPPSLTCNIFFTASVVMPQLRAVTLSWGRFFFVFRCGQLRFQLSLNVAQAARKSAFNPEAAAEGRSLRRLRHEEVVVGRGGKEIHALRDLCVEVGRKQRCRWFKNESSL